MNQVMFGVYENIDKMSEPQLQSSAKIMTNLDRIYEDLQTGGENYEVLKQDLLNENQKRLLEMDGKPNEKEVRREKLLSE